MTAQQALLRTRDRLAHWYFDDPPTRGAFETAVLYVLRLHHYIGRKFLDDQCLQRASGLSYTTTLSLVPVTALFVLYIKAAGTLDVWSSVIQEKIVSTFVAESAQSATVYIDRFIENLNFKTLGTLGALGLLVTAYLTFRTIERSLNVIWAVRKHRSLVVRFQILSSLLILVPGLIFLSLFVSGQFQKLKVLGEQHNLTTMLRSLVFATPFLLTVLPFFLLFKLLPNTRVRWKPAFAAALVTSILFETAKGGFNLYVANFVSVHKIYGSLGLFPVLLLWIYVSWLIILLGVEISHGIQNYRFLHEEAVQNRITSPLEIPIHEEWGLKIVRAMARRFADGKGAVTKEDLAKDVGLKAYHIEDHLQVLSEARVTAYVEQGESSGWVFLLPLDQIIDGEIIRVFREHLGLPKVPASF